MADFLTSAGKLLVTGGQRVALVTPRQVAAAGFIDTFSGSADDPALNTTKWTEKTRTGTSDVNTTVAGKAVCRRFSGAVSGRFTGYATAIYENATSDVYRIRGVTFGMIDGLNAYSLLFRHNTQDQTHQDGTGLGAGDKGYRLMLYPAGVGSGGELNRSDNGSYGGTIDATFTCTGLDDTTPADVIVTVTTLGDRIRVVVNIAGSDVATIDDTSADRLVVAGYGGFSNFASQALGGAGVDMSGFEIN